MIEGRLAPILLNFHGVGVRMRAETPATHELLSQVLRDFRYFGVSELEANPEIEIELKAGVMPVDREQGKGPLFVTRMARVYGWGRERVCRYRDGSSVFAQNPEGQRRLEVRGESAVELYEVLTGLILSVAGEALDLRGFHRTHALGCEVEGNTAVMLAESGGGKSALGAVISREWGARIFSDETPLLSLRNGKVWIDPYPVRIALSGEVASALSMPIEHSRIFARQIFPPKLLFDIPAENIASSAPLNYLIIATLDPSGRPPGFYPVNRLQILGRLLPKFVLGIGMAQMAEHMLRISSHPTLPRIAWMRLKLAMALISKVPCLGMRLSRNARSNAEALTSFLKESRTSAGRRP